jgi:hypothetical protein
LTTRPLLDRLAGGEAPELLRLAAEGLLPVSPEELLPFQVGLAGGPDPELAAAAERSLAAYEPRLVVNFIEREAPLAVVEHFGRRVANPLIVAAVLRRRDVPRPLLAELAPGLSPDLQEALLLRQDAIVEAPAILDALAANPVLSAYARRRIGEYREHLVPGGRLDRATYAEEPPRPGEATDEEVREAVAAVRMAAVEGELDEISGLNEGQLRLLTVSVRLRLARGATRVLRAFLVRDPNPRVAAAVLRENPISEQEVEQYAASRQVNDEVFEEIGRHQSWMNKYAIARALAFNSGVPVTIALRVVPRLSVRDLRALSRDRNVADPVRVLALRLYKIKRL